jgi:hypothetical protein
MACGESVAPPSPSPTGAVGRSSTCAQGQNTTFSIPHRLPKAQLVGEDASHLAPSRHTRGVPAHAKSRRFSSVRDRSCPFTTSLAPLLISLCCLRLWLWPLEYFSGGCRLGSGKGNDGEGDGREPVTDSCLHRGNDAGGLALSPSARNCTRFL